MNKSKTIREWLNELPEPIRGMAIRNAENIQNPLLHLSEISMKYALLGSFVWIETPEGHIFWRIVSMGETPQLPEHLNEEDENI